MPQPEAFSARMNPNIAAALPAREGKGPRPSAGAALTAWHAFR